MSKQVNKTLIGAFILGAVVLAVTAVLILGSGRLLGRLEPYVMYFTGSVNGLRVGAPVKLKGVAIGTVTAINLVYNYQSGVFLNEVLFNVVAGSVKVTGQENGGGPQKKRLTTESAVENMINNGLRAKLQLQSFVTGQLVVAFDFYPNTPIVLMNFESDIPELPTLPSDMEALAKTFDSLDFQAIADSITTVISSVEKLATSPQLQKILVAINDTLAVYHRLALDLDRQVAPISTELAATLADARQLIQSADGQIAPLATQIGGATADLRQTIATIDQGLQPVLDNAATATAAAKAAFEQAETMLTQLTSLSNEESTLVFELEDTLSEIRKAAGALAVLVDYLGRHPEALLRGRHEAVEER